MTGNHENKKYNYITLGNLAKLANIGRDTLSFYSRKGLIRPVYVGENGYKYFLPEQVQTIQFIRFYRKLDFPLETIQNMLDSMEEAKDIKSKDMKNGNPAKDSHSAENADPADQNDAFENQLQYLQRKIEDFRTAAEFLKTEKDFHRYISIHRNDEPFFSDLEEKQFYQTPIRFCHSLNQIDNARKISDFFCQGGNFQIPRYPICCVIPQEALLAGHFCAYVHGGSDREQTDLPKRPEKSDEDSRRATPPYSREDNIVTRSSGTYACLIHTGGTGTISPSIRRLLDHLSCCGVKITGSAYVINSYNFLNVTEFQNSDYIIQIRVEGRPAE